jgi:DNA-binding NarL/FixJ family response regulator
MNPGKTSPVRVLVADDHALVRSGIVGLLNTSPGIEVVAEASDGIETARKALEIRPDVVVLDVSIPGLNGIEAARRIHAALPQTRILMLTMHDEEEYVVRAVRAGASGYLTKDGTASELIAGIRAVSQGRSYFSPPARKAIDRAGRRQEGSEDPYAALTEREREVFRLAVEGRSNEEIGEILSISPKTADNHRTHLMSKLEVHSSAGLVRYAARRGLTSQAGRQAD